ncbi:glutamyl aminopeptidase-like, partial [Stegodyphus dumicola]|uniref:glutamyl aminopeptidase-like n=1 Tax=Stegodyphus dumicola TaxID=202533 RepID=UPI0015A8E73F
MDEFVVSFTQEALSLDSLQNSHPIVIDAIDPQEIEAAFDLIVYKKGASIINMLANVLSMETVQKGLSSYLKKYSFQNARTEDLWNEFTEVDLSHMNVSQIMDTWTRQKGYPLVTVTLEHTTVKVKQERFLLFPDSGNISSPNSDNTSSSDISPYDYKWFVPISYVTDLGNKHSTYWLNMTDGEFALPSEAEWLKINVNQAGFYRVMYDNVLWEKLTNVLHSNHKILTPADRSNLLDDALILSRAGILEAVLAFNVTRYLEKEENYAPWKTAISHFEKLAVLMQDNQVLLSLFQKYVVKLLKPTISALGWKDKGNNVQKKLRSDILTAAVLHGDEQTVCTAMQVFQDWMQNGVKVPPNLRNAVYNAGVQYGGREEWEFCWQQYQQTQVPSEKWLLLVALGKTRDRSLLSLYLNYSLDKDKIKPQDTYLAVSYAAVNLIGRSSTWAFIRSNWVLLLENFSFALPTIITEGISYFSTQADYDEVKAFFSEVTVGAGENALKQSLETIKANIQWRENTEASVTKWLQENI